MLKIPEGWSLVPNVGTKVKTEHPITPLNPSEYFEVTQREISQSGRIAVRGKDTMWFGVGMLVHPNEELSLCERLGIAHLKALDVGDTASAHTISQLVDSITNNPNLSKYL